MAFQFPLNPSTGDTYEKYSWNGSEWILTDQGGGGGVPEAPEDGQEYVRKDGDWVVASGSGGASTLGGLSDVSLASVSNGEALIYNNGLWKNGGNFDGGAF